MNLGSQGDDPSKRALTRMQASIVDRTLRPHPFVVKRERKPGRGRSKPPFTSWDVLASHTVEFALTGPPE